MKETALITGASMGLGAELAKVFAEKGCNLVLTARSGEKLAALKEELETEHKIPVWVFAADLTLASAPAEIFRFTEENKIDVDILVNNAGFGDFGEFSKCSMEKQRDMINLNITALTALTHMFLKGMLERGRGKILNMASIAAFQAGPLMSVYYASKAFVLSFSEALAVELKGSGVTVTALCPGPTRTGFEAAANLSNSGLFKNLKTASAAEVARYGYRCLMKGKTVAVCGGLNRVMIFASKLAPRALARRVVYLIQRVR